MYSTHYFCQILTKIEFSWQIFEKYSKVIFHVRTERQTDMTKLIDAFRNSANAPKICWAQKLDIFVIETIPFAAP
jgi:hypothetical protein